MKIVHHSLPGLHLRATSATIEKILFDLKAKGIFMAKVTDERKQHLELVAATLTGSYYSLHNPGNRDFREIMDTYRYILDALIEQDNLPPGHSSLTATDGLAPFVPNKND